MTDGDVPVTCAKEFAISFTFAVTEPSHTPGEWIAKNGKDSIFSMLRELYPEASTTACKP
jgi:hypothetical protein